MLICFVQKSKLVSPTPVCSTRKVLSRTTVCAGVYGVLRVVALHVVMCVVILVVTFVAIAGQGGDWVRQADEHAPVAWSGADVRECLEAEAEGVPGKA